MVFTIHIDDKNRKCFLYKAHYKSAEYCVIKRKNIQLTVAHTPGTREKHAEGIPFPPLRKS